MSKARFDEPITAAEFAAKARDAVKLHGESFDEDTWQYKRTTSECFKEAFGGHPMWYVAMLAAEYPNDLGDWCEHGIEERLDTTELDLSLLEASPTRRSHE